jgi:23S rRNA (adenine2503-C2)-methyltransferase
MDAPNLFGLDRAGLETLFRERGKPRFHGAQAYRWMYARRVLDPRLWTDLPKPLREALASETRVERGTIEGRAEAADGTVKYRIALPGGGTVESVFMVQRERVTMCISSQVGCALACDFCLTGKMGLTRHLTPGEIVGQVTLLQDDRSLGDTPFNLVFMGMGEPLHNYDGVLGAFRILTDPDGLGMSRRRITVSTSGLVPEIERLSREPARPRLAVSLNATTDAIRERLMPVNKRWPIASLLAACRAYAKTTGEPFTLEYVLLEGVNDSDADVARLEKLLRANPAKLNLIPFNAVPEWLDYKPPSRERITAIRDRLLSKDLRVSIRWSRGADARAACGQLAILGERP